MPINPAFSNFNPLPRKEGDADISRQSVEATNFNPLPRKEGDSRRSQRNRNLH